MVILNVIALIILLILLPLAVGFFILHFANKREASPVKAFIYGHIGLFAILELVGIPIVLSMVYNAYRTFCVIFGITLFAAGGLGVFFTIKDRSFSIKEYLQGMFSAFKALSLLNKILIILLFSLIIFQLYKSLTLASYDVDDFYYNAQALSAQQLGTMYRIDENTGRSIPLDIRHGLALFPMWQAFVSTLSNVHVAIVAHKAVPLILIPLSYMLYYEISKKLFPITENEQKEIDTVLYKRLAFMLLLNVWRLFGHVSYYTSETFLYTRTWQGKSFAGNFILPAVIWIFMCIFEKKKGASLWILLSMLILASGASSSLAVLLSILLTGLLGLIFTLKKKNSSVLLNSALSCIPGVLYILIYMVN